MHLIKLTLTFTWLYLVLATLSLSEPLAPPNPGTLARAKIVPVVARGLENPWGLAFLPDGSFLVTERPGRIRVIRNGIIQPNPLLGIPAVFASGQGGLLDLILHPRFSENNLIYFSYAHGTERSNRTRVARARLTEKGLESLEVIFEASPEKTGGQHFGSRLAWLPDETLLISIGDGGNPPLTVGGTLSRLLAQNKAKHLGKVIRINADGSIPKDNPFITDTSADPKVWSYGHRNIQGMVYDSVSRRVWASEHGSRGGDELNLLQAGKNYGWPVASYSREYSGNRMVAPVTSEPGMEDPSLVWTPSIAPSGLAVYHGKIFPEWNGDLLAGALAGTAIWRIKLDDQNKVIGQERLQVNRRVRDVKVGPDGYVYILVDESDGALLRIEPNDR